MANSAKAIYDRLGEAVPAETFPLESFWVCRDVVVGKQTFRNRPISPIFRTLEEAMEGRARLLETFPDAGI